MLRRSSAPQPDAWAVRILSGGLNTQPWVVAVRRGKLRLEERLLGASGSRFVAAPHLPRKLLPLSPLLPALTWGRGSLLALPRCRAASPSSSPAEELVAVPSLWQTRGARSCVLQQAAKGRFSPRRCWSLLLPAAQLGHF